MSCPATVEIVYKDDVCGNRQRNHELLARTVRAHANTRGVAFHATGRCTAGGTRNRSTNASAAKIVLTSDTHLTDHFEGAVGAYFGANATGLNDEKIIDRKNFTSDNAFAQAVVDLAINRRQFSEMAALPTFPSLCTAD